MRRRAFIKSGLLFVPATFSIIRPSLGQIVNGTLRNATIKNAFTSGLSGPVGWWKFNDGSGTTAADSSGNGFTGTLNGAVLPTWGTGPNSNGDIVFAPTNTDQYVDFGNSSTLKPTAAGTFMCWFRYSTTIGGFTCMMSNGNENSDRNGCNMFIQGGAVAFEVCSGSARDIINGGTALTINTWYHCAATWDGSNIRIYLNGASDATAVTQTQTPSPGFNFTVGSDGNHGAGTFWRDQIDDTRVYNRALSASEISTINSAGAQ